MVTFVSVAWGAERLIVICASSPFPTATGAIVIVPTAGFLTKTLAVTSGMFGFLLAWIVTAPAVPDFPVTGTNTVVAFAGIVTVVGTVATLVLLDDRFNITGVGTGTA